MDADRWSIPADYEAPATAYDTTQSRRMNLRVLWRADGVGQYLPSGEILGYHPGDLNIPQGQYAVKIVIDDPDHSKFPIGAQGAAAIYVDGDQDSWAALRKIAIRTCTWLAWLYPL